MKRLLLVLLMCAPAWSVNDFTGDANVVALWRFENGALTTDSKGANTLTNSGVGGDTTNYKEGLASALFNAVSDVLYRADADLDAGFPFKSGDTTKKITVCGWFRPTSLIAFNRWLVSKYRWSDNERSFGIFVDDASNAISLSIGYNSGASYEELNHASTLIVNTWYHFGITFDDSDKSYRIRIWDDTAGAILGVDKTGTATNNMYAGAAPFAIGKGESDNALSAQVDEIVVFNDILTAAEIDQIRGGTYGAPTGPIEGNAFQMYYNPN